MSFLTVAAIPCYVLADGSAAEQARDYGGSRRRAFDGTLRNTTRWQKRAWAFVVAPTTQAGYDAVSAATALRAIVACGGAAVGGGSVNCSVEITQAPFMLTQDPANANGFLRTMAVTLTEA